MGIIYKDDYKTLRETDKYCEVKLRLTICTEDIQELMSTIEYIREYYIVSWKVLQHYFDFTYLNITVRCDDVDVVKADLESVGCTVEEDSRSFVSRGEVTDTMTGILIERW